MHLSDDRLIPGAVEMIDGENREIRQPCLVLLDVSYSMEGAPLNAVNRAMPLLAQDLLEDPLARQRVEIAVMAFAQVAEVVHDFSTPDEFRPPRLGTGPYTNMGLGLVDALLHLIRRLQLYEKSGIPHYKPWLFLISDGAPTDDITPGLQAVHAAEQSIGLQMFPIGVQGADMRILSSISTKRNAIHLQGLRFAELFQWISISMRAVSTSMPGEKVRLQNTSGWGEIEV